jgi:hypothetical protein
MRLRNGWWHRGPPRVGAGERGAARAPAGGVLTVSKGQVDATPLVTARNGRRGASGGPRRPCPRPARRDTWLHPCVGDRFAWELAETARRDDARPGVRAPGRFRHLGRDRWGGRRYTAWCARTRAAGREHPGTRRSGPPAGGGFPARRRRRHRRCFWCRFCARCTPGPVGLVEALGDHALDAGGAWTTASTWSRCAAPCAAPCQPGVVSGGQPELSRSPRAARGTLRTRDPRYRRSRPRSASCSVVALAGPDVGQQPEHPRTLDARH